MNSSHRPDREKEIFEQAIEPPSAEARLGYIKGACVVDSTLLARVPSLALITANVRESSDAPSVAAVLLFISP